MKNFIVTIDGPAGSGKTTIAREIALRLNWCILESGMLYRAVAWIMAGTEGPDARERSSMIAAARAAAQRLRFAKNPEGTTDIVIDGSPRGADLRTQAVGSMASILAADEEVRAILLPVQRAILKEEPHLIADGRDMGTVVFPDAGIKFFLDAAVQERAGRRYRELLARGETPLLSAVEADLLLRDRQDTERSIAPLRVPADAVIVDTTSKPIPQVVDFMMGVIEQLGIACDKGK